MSSFPTAEEPLLATSIRVLRNKTQIQDLLTSFALLEQKSLNDASTLSDAERRQLLDLPDADEEEENIRQLTALSRDSLVTRVLSHAQTLTDDEITLLKDRFWRDITINETGQIFAALGQTTQEAWERIDRAREPAYLPHEKEAFEGAFTEWNRRNVSEQDKERRAAAEVALPNAPAWIRTLYTENEQGGHQWGFVCLFDGAAQRIDPVRLDHCRRRIQGFFSQTMLHNGARNIIDEQWSMKMFNAPSTTTAPTANNDDSGSALRQAFRDLIRDPARYPVPQGPSTDSLAFGIDPGLLTNTFLVIDPICVDSVLHPAGWHDDMRILAFETDFPQPGRTYAQGYQGWMWVRLEALAYNFYEARWAHADEVGMDQLWRAAQASKNQAFVSLDPEEARIWTTSTSLSGPLPGSVLGRRRERE